MNGSRVTASIPFLSQPAFTLVIRACLEGLEQGLPLPEPAELDLLRAEPAVAARYEKLPASLSEAAAIARDSAFIRACVPEAVREGYETFGR